MSMLPNQPEASRTIVGASQEEYDAFAAADAKAADVIPLAVVEDYYKRPGGTLIGALFGADPLDFWVGRFYVGFFGAVSVLGIIIGTLFYFYQVVVIEGTYNLLQARIDPPPVSLGLTIAPPGTSGFNWQVIVFFSTIAFVGWMMRQVDISRKLNMGYHIPVAFGAVVSSWITLQWLRPMAMGAWGNGFPLGITHHLDWVSNIGYQYYNFFYNPFHAIGVSLLFASTLFLAMHGSAIWSATNRPGANVDHIDTFWRGIVGYSIGEIGIHRLGFWTGAAAVLFANICIFLSGTMVGDWNGFWSFWDRLPIWQWTSASFILIGLGMAIQRRRRYQAVDLKALEANYGGIEGTYGRPYHVEFVNRFFGNGQFGPIYLGVWGVASTVFFGISVFIILIEYLWQVGYNPIQFAREFFVLTLDPPRKEFGLGIAPWHQGGAYLVATFFLHLCVLAWWARLWTRAKATGLGTQLAWGFSAALSLYFVIYLIRPIVMGTWSQAPGHGFKSILDWTNYVSIQYGNFYYNPFHMLSIFFLLGSTLLLAMHGATIVATAPYKSDLELKEMEVEGPGTHRAQLFWRWTMGFNANAASIHYWAWWFAALCAITGAIGLLLSGTLINDWFAWAQGAGIVAPLPPQNEYQQIMQQFGQR
jgi:photosynthetic reaction center M subunit/photosynthetic reaction center L subunit